MPSTYKDLTPIAAHPDAGIPQHEDPRENVTYTGPTMRWLIDNRKLAHQIIATHMHYPTSSHILDDEELLFLRRYAEDPSTENVKDMFKQKGIWDDDTDKRKQNLKGSGSLVGHAIEAGAFDEESIGLLKQWYASAEMREALGNSAPAKY